MRTILIATLTTGVVALGCTRDADRGRDTAGAVAPNATPMSQSSDLPSQADIAGILRAAPDSGEAGGLFHGRAEWAAVVNRKGEVCFVIPPSDSAGGYWPGSRTIAMAKAFTANGFSTDTAPLSTARLCAGHRLLTFRNHERGAQLSISLENAGAIRGVRHEALRRVPDAPAVVEDHRVSGR